MFYPRQTAKVLMQPGGTQGETNGLYAAVTVNNNPARMTIPGIVTATRLQTPSIRRTRARSLLGWS